MQGQHVFMRCWDERGNAGTWTAAMSNDIVSRDTVRNSIEPRCNIDENLAHYALTSIPTNNVLRIYHIGDNTTVISRTFWTSDKITDSSSRGRMGAYSISHILTDEDVVRFSRDFAGAFNVDNFEDYDALIERTGVDKKQKVTLDSSYTLFGNNNSQVSFEILEQCGLTESSFCKLMFGIYYAMENDKQIAVILPAKIRDAWVESGNDMIEQLAYFLMSLIPDFTRGYLGIASHWNGNVKDQMVGDMHLVFVHPENDETVNRLERDGVYVLDVNKDTLSSTMTVSATDYFKFLWKNKNNISAIEDFWSHAKSTFGKLLRKMPKSAQAIDCIYLMNKCIEEKYADKAVVRQALLVAATLFAGAGKLIPEAEQFIADAIVKTGITSDNCDSQTEKALCNLVLKDKSTTAHQGIEYEILLNMCFNGRASKQTVEVLCDDLLQENRYASDYYIKWLRKHKEESVKDMPESMIDLITGMFTRVYCNGSNKLAQFDIATIIADLCRDWAFESLNAKDFVRLESFLNMYAAFLKNGGSKSEIIKTVYSIIFTASVSANETISRKCLDIALAEEKVLYHGKRVIDDGSNAAGMYFQAFIKHFSDADKTSRMIAEAFYARFFRFYFWNHSEIKQIADEAYKSKLEDSSESQQQLAAFLGSEIDVLSEIKDAPAIWNKKSVSSIIKSTEKVNIETISYTPNRNRIAVLGNWLMDDADKEFCEIISYYLSQLSTDDRMQLYSILKSGDKLKDYYSYAFFQDELSRYLEEMASDIQCSHDDMVRLIIRNSEQFSTLNSESSIAKFIGWIMDGIYETASLDQSGRSRLSVLYHLISAEQKLVSDCKRFNPSCVDSVIERLDYMLLLEIESAKVDDLFNLSSIEASTFYDMAQKADKEIPTTKLLRAITKLNLFIDNPNSTQYLSAFESICSSNDSDVRFVAVNVLKNAVTKGRVTPDKINLYLVYIALLNSAGRESFIGEYKANADFKSKSSKEQINELLDLTVVFYRIHSEFEPVIRKAVSNEFASLKVNDARAFKDSDILERYQGMKRAFPEYKSYFAAGGGKVAIDVWTILSCLLIAIIAVAIAFGSWKLLLLVYAGMSFLLAVIGGIVLFAVFVLISIYCLG